VTGNLIQQLTGRTGRSYEDRPPGAGGWHINHEEALSKGDIAKLEGIAGDEWVYHLDDLIFRRTNLWEDRGLAWEAGLRLASIMYRPERAAKELDRLAAALNLPIHIRETEVG
jgi:hypothetical protein